MTKEKIEESMKTAYLNEYIGEAVLEERRKWEKAIEGLKKEIMKVDKECCKHNVKDCNDIHSYYDKVIVLIDEYLRGGGE